MDKNGRPVASWPLTNEQASLSLLRINHYVTKSEEEYRRKEARWAAAGRPLQPEPGWLESLDSEFDEAITARAGAARRPRARLD